VQCHDRLAGAGPSGDLGDSAGRGSDGLILMALDGRDDVAHPAATGAGQGGHERAVADDHKVFRCLGDHQVVLDADHVRTLAAQHSPS